jgi:predicted naringenin-chalcone synthase
MVDMGKFGAYYADDEGGALVVETVDRAGIASKGLAVNPLREEDPRDWSVSERMRTALTEARRLGLAAAEDALKQDGLEPQELGLFATSTSTVYRVPGLETIAADLGVSENAERLCLGPMGCCAGLASLSACRNWVAVHQRPALLVCVDMNSPHLQPPPYDKEQAVIATIFGDAAAAVVLRPAGDRDGLRIVDTETLTVPAYADVLTVQVSETGMYVTLDPTLPRAVSSNVAKPVDVLLRRHDLRREDITWWAVHPGGRRIIEGVAEGLSLPDNAIQASRSVLRDYGNTISASVLVTLRRLSSEHPLGLGEHGMAVAFGPGATFWAVLLTSSFPA